MLGTISFYNRFRGWGFAVPDGSGPDFFVHASNLPANHKYLNLGDRISFEVGEARGKPLAIKIQIIEEASTRGER
jgi:helicase MOV-10